MLAGTDGSPYRAVLLVLLWKALSGDAQCLRFLAERGAGLTRPMGLDPPGTDTPTEDLVERVVRRALWVPELRAEIERLLKVVDTESEPGNPGTKNQE